MLSKLGGNFCLVQLQPGPIKDSHQEGQGGQQEGVQEGPPHKCIKDQQIVKLGKRSTKLGKMSAWVKDYLVPSMTTILKAKVDSMIVYKKDLFM